MEDNKQDQNDQAETADAAVVPDEQVLQMIEAVRQVMPFGKFKGTLLLDLPEPYVVWFKQRGFPKGKLGAQMALVYEIKLNGLEQVFRPMTRAGARTGTTSGRKTAGEDPGKQA